MALFKQFRGNHASLDAQPLCDGYAYFCVDDGTFHIDYIDANGTLHRKQINAKDAETLTGMSLDEIKEYVASIQDVIDELPTENIDEKALYRLFKATFIHNRHIVDNSKCYIVDNKPEIGEPATNLDRNAIVAYYDLSDGKVYGYLDETLAYGFTQLAGTTIVAGWYLAEQLLPIAGWPYAGVITNIGEDPNDSTIRLLLEKKVYTYQNEWIELTNSIVDEKLPTPDNNGHFAYTVQRREGKDDYELHLISHTINEAYKDGELMYPYQIPLRENGIIKTAEPKEDLDAVNKKYVDDNYVPRMHITDEEDGHNRVYYIKSGEPVETTETSVTIPEGKSIIVRAIGDNGKSAYSYLNQDGSPIEPPTPVEWDGALPTPTVTIDGTTASWEAIEGATSYSYIIGDVTPYKSWGGSYSDTHNRVYVELSKNRGIYTRYALTAVEAPLDPDPADFAAGEGIGSIPMRMQNGYMMSPMVKSTDTAALKKIEERGYALGYYLMPKSYTDSYTDNAIAASEEKTTTNITIAANEALSNAKNYTDEQIIANQKVSNAYVEKRLRDANIYTTETLDDRCITIDTFNGNYSQLNIYPDNSAINPKTTIFETSMYWDCGASTDGDLDFQLFGQGNSTNLFRLIVPYTKKAYIGKSSTSGGFVRFDASDLLAFGKWIKLRIEYQEAEEGNSVKLFIDNNFIIETDLVNPRPTEKLYFRVTTSAALAGTIKLSNIKFISKNENYEQNDYYSLDSCELNSSIPTSSSDITKRILQNANGIWTIEENSDLSIVVNKAYVDSSINNLTEEILNGLNLILSAQNEILGGASNE